MGLDIPKGAAYAEGYYDGAHDIPPRPGPYDDPAMHDAYERGHEDGSPQQETAADGEKEAQA